MTQKSDAIAKESYLLLVIPLTELLICSVICLAALLFMN